MKLEVGIFILVFILLLDSVNNIPREASRNISNEEDISSNNNELRKLEVNENYISLLYGKTGFEYRNGFGNSYRSNIDFIESGDFKFNATENFTIKAGSEIKIYFSKSITSFENFFNIRYDDNVANIESIDFSHFDLSLVTSFNRSFSGCGSLRAIKFSNNISSILDLQFMFSDCYLLESIDLTNFNTSSVTFLQGMFSYCLSLKSINLSNFNTSSVINMEEIFGGCNSLESINLSNFNTSSVTNMKGMFRGCNSLKSINLSNFNTSLVSNMNNMFYGCNSLKSINLSNFNTSLVTDMNNIFYGCKFLEKINLSNFNTSLVTNMFGMFDGCSSLESVNLSNFNTSLVTDMNYMFYECASLQLVDISNFNMKNLISCDEMFYNCKNLSYINFLDIQSSTIFVNYIQSTNGLNNIDNLTVCQNSDFINNKNAIYSCCYKNIESYLCSDNYNYIILYYNANSTYNDGFINKYRSNISYIINENKIFKGNSKMNVSAGSKIEVAFSSTLNNFEYFFASIFDKNVANIESIDFSNFDLSLVTSFQNAFSQCSSLKTIKFSKNVSSILDLQYMFYQCSSLELIDLSNFNTSLVTKMQDMFRGCNSLKSINISHFNTSSVTLMNEMFYQCNSLESIYLSNFDFSLVTTMHSMFYSCSSLKSINLSNLKCRSLKNMGSMFYGCSSLESINLSNFDSSSLTSMNSMFSECSSLQIIDFSNFVTSSVKNMYSMFRECSSLKSINLSNFDTSSVTFMARMFEGCSSLQVLDISNFNMKNLITCGEMFYNCQNLRYVNFLNIQTSSAFVNCIQGTYGLNNIENLIVCQNSNIITNQNAKYTCCDHYNIEANLCIDNYIIVYYQRDADYNYGFINKYRNSFSFVIYQDHVYQGKQRLYINSNTKVEIVFSNTITSLQNFFSHNFDKNVDFLKSIDLSHCDLSQVTSFYRAFYSMNCLESIKFPKNISSVLDLGNMLYFAPILRSIDLSSFDTSLVTDMERMFEKCRALRSLNLSNFNTSSVITMQRMFYECLSLETIDISNFNTSSCREMAALFYNCIKLKSINLSNFDTSLVTGMYGMFCYCNSLKSINVSSFNTSLVSSMKEMFRECTSLISINLSNFITSRVENMYGMFNGCTSLKSINLSNFDTSSVFNMEIMFRGCNSLRLIDISNFNMKNVIYSAEMFLGCKNLGYINFLGIQASTNVQNYLQGGADGLNNIDNLNVCQNSDIITNPNAKYTCCDYNIEKKSCYFENYIILYYNSNSTYNNGFINEYRTKISYIINENKYYEGNSTLNITSGSKVKLFFSTTITSFEYFFASIFDKNVANIESIDFSNFDLSLVTSFNSSFRGCRSLKTIIFSNNISSILDLQYMFYQCISIESIDLTNFNTSLVTNMKGTFYQCSSLITINLSNFNTSSVTNMEEIFNRCTSLKSIILSNFDTSSVQSMEEMFSGCISLELLDISNFNLKNINNHNNMFYECENLRYINFLDIQTSDTFLNYIQGTNGLNNINNLTVCQNSDIITNPNAIYTCCDYNIETNSCNSPNFLVLNYNQNCNYSNGFKNKYRDGISFITYNNSFKSINDKLEIMANSKIEIYFNNRIQKMDNFFSQAEDTNLQYVTLIDLSNFDASLTTNMSSLFSGCRSLKSINFGNINTSSAIDMSNMFYLCRSLELENLSNFDTSKVTNMANMFNGCRSIKSLNLSNFNTSSVINMNSLFMNCRQVITIDISHFDLSKVSTISYFFAQCTLLKNVYYLSKLDSPNVVNRIGIFDGCISLFGPDNPDYQSGFNETDMISDSIIMPQNINILMLGVNKLMITNSKVSFNIYFLSFDDYTLPQTLNLSSDIIYNSLLRLLDNKNVECQKEDLIGNVKYKYGCNIDIQNSNIKNISINRDIDFGLDNINMEISPLVSNYLDNIQNIPKTYDNMLDGLNTYRLKNCAITDKQENSFDISGLMEGQPNYELNKNLVVIASHINDQTQGEINCRISDNSTNKYTLSCYMDDNEKYELDNSISIIGNDTLLIDFEDNPSTIEYNITSSPKKLYYRKESGISTGAIVAIIIIPIVILGFIIVIIYFIRNKNIRKTELSESTNGKINITNKV